MYNLQCNLFVFSPLEHGFLIEYSQLKYAAFVFTIKKCDLKKCLFLISGYKISPSMNSGSTKIEDI